MCLTNHSSSFVLVNQANIPTLRVESYQILFHYYKTIKKSWIFFIQKKLYYLFFDHKITFVSFIFGIKNLLMYAKKDLKFPPYNQNFEPEISINCINQTISESTIYILDLNLIWFCVLQRQKIINLMPILGWQLLFWFRVNLKVKKQKVVLEFRKLGENFGENLKSYHEKWKQVILRQ